MASKKELKVELLWRGSYWDTPQNVTELIAWLQERISTAPEEYREAVCFEVGYDDIEDVTNAELCYYRPLTDDELARTEALRARMQSRIAEHEIAQLKALREKYPEV